MEQLLTIHRLWPSTLEWHESSGSSPNNTANLSSTLNLLLGSLNSPLGLTFMTPHLSSNFKRIIIDRRNFTGQKIFIQRIIIKVKWKDA